MERGLRALWRVKKLEEEGAEWNRKQDAELCWGYSWGWKPNMSNVFPSVRTGNSSTQPHTSEVCDDCGYFTDMMRLRCTVLMMALKLLRIYLVLFWAFSYCLDECHQGFRTWNWASASEMVEALRLSLRRDSYMKSPRTLSRVGVEEIRGLWMREGSWGSMVR